MTEQDFVDTFEADALRALIQAINADGYVDAIVETGYHGTNKSLAESAVLLRTAMLRFGYLFQEACVANGLAAPV